MSEGPRAYQKVTSPLVLDPEIEQLVADIYLDELGATDAERRAVEAAARAILEYERWTRLPRYGAHRGKSYSALRGQKTADEILGAATDDLHRWCALAQAAFQTANARRGHKITPAHLRRKNRQQDQEAA